MPELDHAKHVGLAHALDVDDLVLTVPTEQVAGGAGFVNASGAVALDLDDGRAFHHTMTGNITGLTFSNVPTAAEFEAGWRWVLRIDATGGYTLAGTPTVTFVDGRSFADADLAANAENIFTFWRVGSITYAALITNGSIEFDPYKLHFIENATVTVLTENESIDVANATKNGDGTITFQRNGSAITVRTDFSVGDRLSVTCATATTATSVRVPRYAL